MTAVLFWIALVMALLNLGCTVYCLAHGVTTWSGIIMAAFWLFLAFVHARKLTP